MSIKIVYGYSGEELVSDDGRGAEWHRYAGVDQFGDIVGTGGQVNGFGEITMRYGYGSYFGGYTENGAPASDDTASLAAQLGVPDGTDLMQDQAALLAVTTNTPYVTSLNVDPGIASNVNNWIQTAAMFATQLANAWAAASPSQQNALQMAYENTQNNISNFQSLGQQLMQNTSDQAKISSWVAVGQSIISTANSIANELGTSAVSAVKLFEGFPQSVVDVLAWSGKKVVEAVKFIVDQAGQITKQASWSIAEIVLVVGGAALLVLWGAKKAGVKLDLPFVSLNGYNRRRGRRTSRRGRNRR